MRKRFDQQLDALNVSLIEMGALCEDAINLAVKAFLADDKTAVSEVISLEVDIDRKERAIESACLALLLQQQPVATDLRKISSALKLVSDLERIGDQAADIAEIVRHIKKNGTRSRCHIEDMAKAVTKMVTSSVDSYVKHDLGMAVEVIAYDDVVDDLFLKVRSELTELIAEDRSNADLCLDLLMIAKYFERIGDHAVNVAEWVAFSITGEHPQEVNR